MYQIRVAALLSTLVFSTAVTAQSIGDALEFSNGSIQGTARSAGFGNALGSVGGDFGGLSVNPAGIGIYRRSELSFSPSLKMNGASSQYSGATTMDNGAALNVNNFGYVATRNHGGRRYEQSGWKSVSFAFGMNKTADFTRNYTWQGKNTTSSATQAMESDANLNPGNESTPGTLGFLGYQGYLLSQDSAGKFVSVVPFQGGILQKKNMQTRGGINEYLLSLGGNYKDRLMLGFTIGIPTLNYNYSSSYSEEVAPGNTNNPDTFSSFSYNKSISVTGSGINLKLGAIYKLTNSLRIGVAIHSPTYYNLSETYTPSLASNVGAWTNYVTTNDFQIGSQFDYHLSTPWKGVLSATYMFGSRGFVSADMEYIDYSSMHYRFPGGFDDVAGVSFQQEENEFNQAIKNTYKSAVNLRVGGEFVISKMFMLRAGIGYYGNAYQAADLNSQRTDMSLGVGWHFASFFTDLGFVHSEYKVAEQPYTVDYSGVVSGTAATIPQAQINYQLNSLIWTIGFKFR